MPPTVLSHRHQNSTTSSTSSTSSSSSSARPALPRILTNSPSNAVHLSRSTARTSRRVRSNWFTHFALTWRRSSRYSKIVFGYSLTLLTVQVSKDLYQYICTCKYCYILLYNIKNDMSNCFIYNR